MYFTHRSATISSAAQSALRQEQLVNNEHVVDAARNAFIQRSTAVLQQGLSDMHVLRPTLESAPSARFFDEGYQRFSEILQKFLLLSQIQTGTTTTKTKIDLHTMIDNVLEIMQDEINAKRLTIVNEIPEGLTIGQNGSLFTFVIQSLIDNAIKFNNESGTVVIKANPAHHTLRIAVSDTGIGIPKDKLPQLFKPFSRAWQCYRFQLRRPRFQPLFLDKIITDYMGGTIKAVAPEKGWYPIDSYDGQSLRFRTTIYDIVYGFLPNWCCK